MAGRTLMHMLLLTAAKLPVVPVSAIKLVAALTVLVGIVGGLGIGGEEGDGSIRGIKLSLLLLLSPVPPCHFNFNPRAASSAGIATNPLRRFVAVAATLCPFFCLEGMHLSLEWVQMPQEWQ